MPSSDKTSGLAKKLAPLAAATVLLLLLAIGLSPTLLGDHRDLINTGSLLLHDDQENGQASGASSLDELEVSTSAASSSAPAEGGSEQSSSSLGDPSDASSSEAGSSSASADDAQANIDYAETFEFTKKIEAYMQFPEVGGGCEIAAMASVIRSLGYDLSAPTLYDTYIEPLPGEKDMVHGYSGSAYGQGAAFPLIMVRGGNAYLREQGSAWRFVERKGDSLGKLLAVVASGRPVLVWTTMSLAPVEHTESRIDGYEWYTNEHCVVLYGTAEEGRLLVMDPLEGLVERDRKAFEDIYNECGRHAVSISRAAKERVDADEAALNDALSKAEKDEAGS